MAFKTLPNLSADKAFTIGKTGEPERVEGFYIGAKKVPNDMSQTGHSLLHIFQTAAGNVGAWGKMSLDSQLAGVAPGTMTRITFTGFVKSNKPGRKPAYGYLVEVDDSNTISVAKFDGNNTIADEEYEESDADSDTSGLDEAEYTPPVAPKQAARAPSAEKQAAVRNLLKR